MINIAELLKDAPKGLKLYSPLFGEVEFAGVMDTDYVPIRIKCGIIVIGERFDKYGRYKGNEYPNAECLLFPSKDCRTWEGWSQQKPHYDISNFKPFDKVLVRDNSMGVWCCSFYSHYARRSKLFYCAGIIHNQCIPFEGNEHLLGTTDMPSEEFINW